MALDEEWTFRSLHDDARAAVDWLAEVGVPSRGHRLQRLVRDLDSLAVASDSGTLNSWVDNDEFRAAMFTLVEAADLRRIHRAFASRPTTPGLLRRLRKSVKGPRSGTIDQKSGLAEGRNYLAELSVAAMFVNSGVEVDIELRPDMLTPMPLVGTARSAALAWEVKRPTSPEGVERCLSDAARQIRTAVTDGVEDPSVEVVAGVSVLVLDHVIPPFFALPAPDDATLRSAQRERLRTWAGDHARLLRRTARDGLCGVMLYWRPIGRLGAVGRGQRTIECREVRFEGIGFPATGYNDVAGGIVSSLRA